MTKCKAQVPNYTQGWASPTPCNYKAKKDGYCMRHHPDKIRASEQRADQKRKALWNAKFRI